MELKDYQRRVLGELEGFLSALAEERESRAKIIRQTPPEVRADVATGLDFVKKAWHKSSPSSHSLYYPHKDGIGEPLPDVYVKVPTGGGKTLIACHAIDRIMRHYLRWQAGLVVWIVPTSQIYNQTLAQLRDRSHPYRQLLEIAGGGRFCVAERRDKITPADVRDKLAVLLLMLPAANRQSKDTLKMYRDSGNYEEFFPDEEDAAAHRALLDETPNMDAFGESGGFAPQTIKTSLANVFRLCRPLMIVDEGHKAYSANARETIREFNPAFVLELSATPPTTGANIAAKATGRDLDSEEMVKLDINLDNINTADWKTIVLAAMNKRRELERAADIYLQNSNRRIRPITLYQVEYTGKDKRGAGRIHAEDVREFLLQSGVSQTEIAVKSADIDELAGADLLGEECQIRHIITKQALQEGWDCSFAYILAVLSNLKAQTAMTQLVGRVLRQPGARKTGVAELDECYVYTRSQNAGGAVAQIKEELEKEGLGDLSMRINSGASGVGAQIVTARMREEFKRFEGRLYFPQFVYTKGKKPRLLTYEGDILANLEWGKLRAKKADLAKINLADAEVAVNKKIGLADRTEDGDAEHDGLAVADPVVMARQILDVVPNPWYGYPLSEKILRFFAERDGREKTDANFVFIIEESRKMLAAAIDKMAKAYFCRQVQKGDFELLLFTGDGKWRIPGKVQIRSERKMNRADGNPLKKSLMDYIPDGEMNELEKSVALYLDEQERLLWWYRNHIHNGYHLQGWKRGKIHPDFMTAENGAGGGLEKVRVIEMKGAHLLGNEDTQYKKSVFELCNDLCQNARGGRRQKWEKLGHEFRFCLVDSDDWRSVMNGFFAANGGA